MLTIRKEMDLNDFINYVWYELDQRDIDLDALEIMYDFLVECYPDGLDSEMLLDDIIRYDMNVQSAIEVVNDYNIDIYEDATDEEITEAVENYINYNGLLYGTYEDSKGVTWFVYNNF